MKKLSFACALIVICTITSLGQTTVTPNIGLQNPAYGSTNWQVPWYYNTALLDNLLSGNGSLSNLLVSWRSTVTYPAGVVVTYNGIAYESLQAPNLNHEPDLSGSYWGKLSTTGNTGISGAGTSGLIAAWTSANTLGNAMSIFQTNGTDNAVQSKLNLIAGTNTTVVSDAAGGVTINSTGFANVYASTIPGIHQNTNLVTGGGTDDTAVLQAVLTSAYTNNIDLNLIIDGPSLITGLQYAGHTRIDCTPGAGFYLASGSNVPVLQNMHRVNTGTTIDNNVVVNGCTINGNYAGQNGINGTGTLEQVGFEAAGVSNLVVSNVTMNQTTNYGFWLFNVFGVQLINDTYNANSIGVFGQVDGFHFNGPASNIYANNLTVNNSNDDNFALNADDGTPTAGLCATNFQCYGPITDVLVEGLHLTGGYNGVRLLSNGLLNPTGTGSIIDRVIFKNITGVLGGSLYYIDGILDPEGTGKSNVRSVTFDTVDIVCHTYATTFYAACIYLNDTFADLKNINFKIDMTQTTSGFLTAGTAGGGNIANGVPGRLSFDNLDLTLYPTTGYSSAPFTIASTTLDTFSLTNLKARTTSIPTGQSILTDNGTIANSIFSNWTLSNLSGGYTNNNSMPTVVASNVSTNCPSPQTCFFANASSITTAATNLHVSNMAGFKGGISNNVGSFPVVVYEGNGAGGVIVTGTFLQTIPAGVYSTIMDVNGGYSRLFAVGNSTSAQGEWKFYTANSTLSSLTEALDINSGGMYSQLGILAEGLFSAPLTPAVAIGVVAGQPEVIGFGPNTSTQGSIIIGVASSDGSVNTSVGTVSSAGVAFSKPISAPAVSSSAASCSGAAPFMEYTGVCGAASSGSGTVGTSGSPVSGNLAAFSSSTLITAATSTQIQTAIGAGVYDASGAATALKSAGNTWSSVNSFNAATNFGSTGQVQIDASGNYKVGSNLLFSPAAPTISSGFGTGATISANSGTASFLVSVGTGGTASTGIVGLPTASTGWGCVCQDDSTFSATVFLCRATPNSTAAVLLSNFNSSATSTPWASGDVLQVSCYAR